MKQQQGDPKVTPKQSHSITKQIHSTNVRCIQKIQTSINIDCIKVCPMNDKIWAFSFYQQHPQFVGGIQIIKTQQLQSNKELKVGECEGYVQMGPIMHIEWLNTRQLCESKKENRYSGIYYILAAARCDQAIICSFERQSNKLRISSKIMLQSGVFCLYCDWRLSLSAFGEQLEQKLSTVAVVSTNQSTVFFFSLSIGNEQVAVGQIQSYTKHQYAVWACRINPSPSSQARMIAGDEVDCLYLYDVQNKTLLAKNKKAHTQGICEIYWPKEEWVLTGSFDGTIAQIYIQNFTQTTKVFKLGGTIWRIIPIHHQIIAQQQIQKVDKKDKIQVGGSCSFLICNSSQKKFQIFNTQKGEVVWDSGQAHESLAYAADVRGDLLFTASFYDKKLRVWECQLK